MNSSKLKRLGCMAVGILLGAVIFAGGAQEKTGGAGGQEKTLKKEIIIANATDITNLDPQGSNTAVNKRVFSLTHETLFRVDLDNPGGIVPGILRDYEALSDREYKFYLQEGALFSNGVECKASDVKFTFDRAKSSSFTSKAVKLVESVEVVDDYAVVMTLSEPSQEILMTLADETLSILSEAAFARNSEDASSIGTGPYKLEKWVPGDYISLVRNDDYWGKKAITEKVTFRLIAEGSSRVIALSTGEIDICLDPPPVELSYITDDKNLSLIQMPGSRMTYFAFNVQKDILNERNVRQAIAYAINKEDIIAAALEGRGTVHNTTLNVGLLGFNDNIYPYDYNIEKAKSMLAEAGYPDGFEMVLTVTGTERNTVGQILQAQLNSIGIHVHINNMESAAQKAMLNEGGHQAVIYSWSNSTRTDYTARNLFYSGSGSNRMFYANPELDSIIDAALIEPDQAKRIALYNDFQEFTLNEVSMIPLYTDMLTVGVKADLQGAKYHSGGRHDYRYMSLYE